MLCKCLIWSCCASVLELTKEFGCMSIQSHISDTRHGRAFSPLAWTKRANLSWTGWRFPRPACSTLRPRFASILALHKIHRVRMWYMLLICNPRSTCFAGLWLLEAKIGEVPGTVCVPFKLLRTAHRLTVDAPSLCLMVRRVQCGFHSEPL